MTDLTKKKCVPCLSDAAPLKREALRPLYMQLDEGWEIVDEHHLVREYKFKNFKHALAFTNVIGKVAEEEEHHPDIFLSWGMVKLKVWTHKINGLPKVTSS